MRTLVTGGGGFLGGAIVRQLLTRGDTVRSFSRREHAALRKLGVEQCRGDLADRDAVRRAADGCDCLFHVAAKAGVWGRYGAYYRANVVGTRNVVRVCEDLGITRLIYTSSPSVVFNGKDMENVDESAPYATHFQSHYPRTKMLAEKAVLAANGPRLATVALRPHLIWGPGDNHLVPRIIERGRAGQLRRIGFDEKLVDSVFIDDAARAHVLAAEALKPEAPLAGQAYFITQGEPLPVWDLIDKILAAADLPPVARRVSTRSAYAAGFVLETVHRLLGLEGEPRMTRFVARELSTAHWFDISRARRDFGYQPTLTIDEGLARLKLSLQGGSS